MLSGAKHLSAALRACPACGTGAGTGELVEGINFAKGLAIRFFTTLRMTFLRGYETKWINVIWFDLGVPCFRQLLNRLGQALNLRGQLLEASMVQYFFRRLRM